jgi:hypothetical protein
MSKPQQNEDPNEGVDPTTREPAGRVEVDSRGNNVWRWARDVLENTSVLLKRLENKDLALEPTQKVPIVRDGVREPNKTAGARAASARPEQKKPAKHPALEHERPRDTEGGFDPYNSR